MTIIKSGLLAYSSASVGIFMRRTPMVAVCAGHCTTAVCSIPGRPFHLSTNVRSFTKQAPFARSHLGSFARYPSRPRIIPKKMNPVLGRAFLQVTLANPTEPRAKNIHAPSIDSHVNEQVQTNMIRTFNTSTLAKPSQYNRYPAREVEIVNGQPEEANGLPIGLFHPVFDAFQRRISSTTFAPTETQLASTHRLLATSSQEIHNTETGTGALKPQLDQLLGFPIRDSPIPGTKPDGVIQGLNGAYPMIMDVGSDISISGDPSIEGAVAFANHWSDSQSKWLRTKCCCPSMILAISGPWMCVLGGIMLQHPVIQPLTPFFWVGNNPTSPGHADTVAKIFASLAESLSELDVFYQGFQRSDGTRNSAARCTPHIQHFICDGKRVDIKYTSLKMRGKPVFEAVARPEGGESYKVIVKFAESYNAAAHRVLEQMNLAPKLFFVSSEGPDAFKVTGRIMVVMGVVPGKDLSLRVGHPPGCVLRDVERALDALHKHNMVYGDLRRPNVMGLMDGLDQLTGAMMIDFDWCGTAGQVTYPMTMNWPEGVGPGLPIQPEHDREMLKRFRVSMAMIH